MFDVSEKPRRPRQALSVLVSCAMAFSLFGAPAVAHGEETEQSAAVVAGASQPAEESGSVASGIAPDQETPPASENELVAESVEERPSADEGASADDALCGDSADMPAVPEDDLTDAPASSEDDFERDMAANRDLPTASVGAYQARAAAASERATAASYADVLAGCAVTLDRTEPFTAEDDEVAVSVNLHESVPRCYLTLFAYAGNTAFDPDASQNIRLWAGMVRDGDELTCPFNSDRLPLKPGYKVIACLNVPVAEDYYRPVNSAPIDVVDEQGESFVDYVYPDATIDETELEAGETSLHVSLSGDERLFEAARAGQISLTVSVAQYPADAEFDFESADQIPLCSPMTVTEALDGREIELSEPLRAGYRVRAVVYWSQNPDIFLVKGNDYEASFHRPDDSVLVSESRKPAVTIEGPAAAGSNVLAVRLSGDIQQESVLLVKSYSNGVTPSLATGDILASNVSVGEAGTIEVFLDSALAKGTQVVAYLLKNGLQAQSDPVSVTTSQPYHVELLEPLTSASTKAVVRVEALETSLVDKTINVVRLVPVADDGTVDTGYQSALASAYLQTTGVVELDLGGKELSAGSEVCVYLAYNNFEGDYLSDPFTVGVPMAADDLVLLGDSVAVDAEELAVNVSGYEEMKGGRLIATTGSSSTVGDADSRTQLGSVIYAGAGTYRIPVAAGRLSAGQTVQVHLYKYDVDTDATVYRYGNALPVMKSTAVVEPQVSIVTQNITDDRTDVWAQVNFDPSLTGTVALYCHEGALWTAADLIWTSPVDPQEYSQRLSFGTGKLTGGRNLTAVLTLSDGATATSPSVAVQKAPEPVRPIARIKDTKVTAGMTTLHAELTFDTKVSEAAYTLHRLKADGSLGDAITSGTLYRPDSDRSLYLGVGKVAVGDRLQLVLTADGATAESNVVEVLPSPEWGGAYVAFGAAAATPSDRSIPVTVSYADEYLAMDDFYCDISVYEVAPFYSDDQIEAMEIWENFAQCRRVGQLNSTIGDVTRGTVSVPVREGVELTPGMRLFVKVRLPHVEWADEEVDYLSASIPVLEAGEELPPTKVLLYNLGSDTARGAQVRAMLADMGVTVETVSEDDLPQEIGYLAGLAGFEKTDKVFSGTAPGTEFMLMCGMGEALLDQFLDRMQADGLRINHKAIVTEYNRYYTLAELIGDIEEEHEVFRALLALDKALGAASALSADEFGSHELWKELQEAIDRGNAVLGSEEPALFDLQAATKQLNDLVATLTSGAEPDGPDAPDPTPAPGGDPDPEPNPGTNPAEPDADPTPGDDNSGGASVPGGNSGLAPTRPAGNAGTGGGASNGAAASQPSRGGNASDRAARSFRVDGQSLASLEGRAPAPATASDAVRTGQPATTATVLDTSGTSSGGNKTPSEATVASVAEEGDAIGDEAAPLAEGVEEQSAASQTPLWAAVALIAVVAAACGLVLGWRRRAAH